MHRGAKVLNADGTGCRWPHLVRLMTALLCLPHANADVERLFSALKLVKTRLRNRLLQRTLLMLLLCKLNAAKFGMDAET